MMYSFRENGKKDVLIWEYRKKYYSLETENLLGFTISQTVNEIESIYPDKLDIKLRFYNPFDWGLMRYLSDLSKTADDLGCAKRNYYGRYGWTRWRKTCLTMNH